MDKESLPEIPDTPDNSEHISYLRFGAVARKASVELMKRFATPEFFQRGILPTPNVQALLKDLHKQAEGSPYQEEWNLFFENLFPRFNRLHLMANNIAHTDTWLRDDEYIFEFVESPLFQDHTLKVFERRQRRNGQMPTAVGIVGQTAWHFVDDESTLLYIISTASLIQKDKSFMTPKRKECIEKAYEFIKKHIHNGMYVTPAGERRCWIDAFEFPESDVITQNQGLYVVALLALSSLRFDIPAKDVFESQAIYQKLADKSGYFPFTYRFEKAIGAGSLYPDYLAITRYDYPLATDSQVANTIENIPRSKNGVIALAASPKGEAFDPKYFKATYQSGEEGNYQNYTVWDRWWNNLMAVGELHHVLTGEDLDYRTVIKIQQRRSNFAESIRARGIYEDLLTPVTERLTWEITVPAEHRTVDRVLGNHYNSLFSS